MSARASPDQGVFRAAEAWIWRWTCTVVLLARSLVLFTSVMPGSVA